MLRAAVILWFAWVALLGPRACCWLCCSTSPDATPPAAAETLPADPVDVSCAHCCSQETAPASAPAEPCDPAAPDDSCPNCLSLVLANAVTPTAVQDAERFDPWGELLPDGLATPGVPGTLSLIAAPGVGPPAPFPSARDLVRVFHRMRC